MTKVYVVTEEWDNCEECSEDLMYWTKMIGTFSTKEKAIDCIEQCIKRRLEKQYKPDVERVLPYYAKDGKEHYVEHEVIASRFNTFNDPYMFQNCVWVGQKDGEKAYTSESGRYDYEINEMELDNIEFEEGS